jgi:cell division protein FtsZ
VLLSIAGGSDLGLFEINEAAALVSQAAHAEANIIFGATIDDALGDEVRVTVIAAGFDGGMPKRRHEGTVLRQQAQQSQAETRAAAEALAASRAASTPSRPAEKSAPASSPSSSPAPGSASPNPSEQSPTPAPAKPKSRQVQFDDDDLDVPDFLK